MTFLDSANYELKQVFVITEGKEIDASWGVCFTEGSSRGSWEWSRTKVQGVNTEDIWKTRKGFSEGPLQ